LDKNPSQLQKFACSYTYGHREITLPYCFTMLLPSLLQAVGDEIDGPTFGLAYTGKRCLRNDD